MASVSSSMSPVAATAAKSAAAEASPLSSRGRLLKYPYRPLGIQSRLLVSLDLLYSTPSLFLLAVLPPQRQNPQFYCSLVQVIAGTQRLGFTRANPPQIVGEEEVFKESSALCQLSQHFSPKSSSCRFGAWSALSQYSIQIAVIILAHF
jgi:hypothetical protein